MKLAGKVAVVTGGANGIGEATIRLFHAEGAKIVVVDLAEERGARIAEDISAAGGDSLFVPGDVSQEHIWQQIAHRSVEKFGTVDILVNNAGTTVRKGVMEHTLADWQRVMDVNLTGAFLGIQNIVPTMASSGGAIVNVSSVAGVTAATYTAYTASKWGLRGLTRSAALELADLRIRVNSVCPGAIDNSFAGRVVGGARPRNVPLNRLASSNDIARAILYLSSPDSDYVTGTDLLVDGGLTINALRKAEDQTPA